MDEALFYAWNAWKTGKFKLPAGIVERDIHIKAVRYLKEKEILVLLGLRQTGKSTLTFQLIDHLLSEKVAPDRIFYFSFDDLSLRQELSASHASFTKIVERYLGEEVGSVSEPLYLFIDEVQKLPGFVEYVKSLYDLKYPIKWVITGSASLELKAQVKESLAGRVLNLTVSPFSERETFDVLDFSPPDKKELWKLFLTGNAPDMKRLMKLEAGLLPHKTRMQKVFEDCLVFGSLPAVVLAHDAAKKADLLKNYRETYLDQDIRNLVKEDKLWVYQRVMELLAGRIGDLLNYSNIASELEVTVDTIKRYCILLEKTFILKNLSTYSRNVRNEILKTPKVYFTDLGIRNSLLNLNSLSQLERLGQMGMALENMILERMDTAIRQLEVGETRLHYWRTKAKEEVDIVIEAPEHLLPVEVKSDRRVQAKHLRGLRSFLEKEKEQVGILVGRFDKADIIDEGKGRIYLMPYWML
ncbi:MAG: ATP-binding protein [Deltaproteobacteria bacterium]|nr:ATP-binding protein [Deltaproteobacteria bacterium]